MAVTLRRKPLVARSNPATYLRDAFLRDQGNLLITSSLVSSATLVIQYNKITELLGSVSSSSIISRETRKVNHGVLGSTAQLTNLNLSKLISTTINPTALFNFKFRKLTGLTSGLTFIGLISNNVSKSFSGALDSVGPNRLFPSITKLFSGSISFSAPSVFNGGIKIMRETTGNIRPQHTELIFNLQKSFSGSLNLMSELMGGLSIAVFSGALNFTTELTKKSTHRFFQFFNINEDTVRLLTKKASNSMLSGAITYSSSVAKKAKISFSGALHSIAGSVEFLKKEILILASTLSNFGSNRLRTTKISKNIRQDLVQSGEIFKKGSISLDVILQPITSIILKRPKKTLDGNVTPSKQSLLKLSKKALQGSLTNISGIINRKVSLAPIVGVLTWSGSIFGGSRRRLMIPAATLQIRRSFNISGIQKELVGIINPVGNITKRITTSIEGTLIGLNGNVRKTLRRALDNTLNITSPILIKKAAKETISKTISISRNFVKRPISSMFTFTATLTPSSVTDISNIKKLLGNPIRLSSSELIKKISLDRFRSSISPNNSTFVKKYKWMITKTPVNFITKSIFGLKTKKILLGNVVQLITTPRISFGHKRAIQASISFTRENINRRNSVLGGTLTFTSSLRVRSGEAAQAVVKATIERITKIKSRIFNDSIGR